MHALRRFVTGAATVSLLFVGVSSADAHGSHDGEGRGGGKGGATVTTKPVDFTITSAVCGRLAAGVTIAGSGTLTSRLKETVKGGVTTKRFADHAEGTATDQAGNSYTWAYDNALVMRNGAATPTLFAGEMTDSFTLKGGPNALANGFEATYVEDTGAGTFGIYPSSSFGDPFTFPAGPNLCDPL